MPYITRIYGAAGTGKTTWIYENVLSQRQNLQGLLAISFTKAAKTSLLAKEPRLQPWQVRTLHSICFKALGLEPKNLLTEEDVERFMQMNGYYYVANEVFDDTDMFTEKTGNTLYRWYGRLINELPFYYNNNQIDIKKFYSDHAHLIPFSRADFIDFFVSFREYMFALQKFDYTYILALAYLTKVKLSGETLVLDEAQDLSPIMIAILERNFHNFKEIYILGDDDQTIYHSLNGADAKFLLQIKADKNIILPKSYRLPESIWKISREYISKNKNRVPKDYTHNGDKGQIITINDEYEILQDSFQKSKDTFLLCRHKHLVKKLIQRLDNYKIPYGVLGKESKLEGNILSALITYVIIKEKQSKKISEVMFKNFLNALSKELRKEVFGTVSIPEIIQQANFTFSKYPEDIIATFPNLANIVALYPSEIFKNVNKKHIDIWYERVKDEENLPHWLNPFIKIGTIHQSKGLEAKRVLVYMDVTKKTYESIREEHERRVWYVALTRAKNELYIVCKPNSKYINEELAMMVM